MNREVKYRGKDLENGNCWRYGSLVVYPDGNRVIVEFDKDENELSYDVYPETVGQFAGKYDKNGKEIYEGDIVKTKEYGKFLGDKNFSGYDHFEVHFKNGGFRLENEERIFNLTNNSHLEVVGNVHDNPSLLKGGEE